MARNNFNDNNKNPVAGRNNAALAGGRNTTAITNPKTRSQNTTANTTSSGGKIIASPNVKATQKDAMRKAEVQQAVQKNAAKNSMNQKKAMQQQAGGKNPVKTAMAKSSNCKWEISMENCQLTDLDIISDVLSTQKGIIGKYTKAICEVDCENLRKLINTQMSECATDQFDSFLYMNQRGMYPTENAPAPKINQMKKKFTDYAKGIKK